MYAVPGHPSSAPGPAAGIWAIGARPIGFVGADILLYSSINLFQWQAVSVILIAIFAVVVVSEFVSATVRQRIT